MSINRKKYEQVILYLCSKLGGEVRGKKTAKLLYFADFDFLKISESITGDVYKAFPRGPLPGNLELLPRLWKKQELKLLPSKNGANNMRPTEIYKCLVDPDKSAFSKDEIKMLDRVTSHYGNLNGEQLAELSHAEAPYTATELYKEIPYEVYLLSRTDFSDL